MEERIVKDINDLLTQLFQKMKESNYEWDAENRQLKRINNDVTQEPKWTEEDERMMYGIIADIEYAKVTNTVAHLSDEIYNNEEAWLMAIKDRIINT